VVQLMKWKLLWSVALAILSACTTNRSPADSQRYDIALEEARDDAAVNCVGRVECDAVWQRTLEFVTQHSATKIWRVNQTSIETGKPCEFGVLYIWASRTVLSNDVDRSTIRIKGLCRGMYTSDGTPAWMYETCAELIMQAAKDYHVYVTNAYPEAGAGSK
jgi:hypothetical protein